MSELLLWLEFFGRAALIMAPIAGLLGLLHVLLIPEGGPR